MNNAQYARPMMQQIVHVGLSPSGLQQLPQDVTPVRQRKISCDACQTFVLLFAQLHGELHALEEVGTLLSTFDEPIEVQGPERELLQVGIVFCHVM